MHHRLRLRSTKVKNSNRPFGSYKTNPFQQTWFLEEAHQYCFFGIGTFMGTMVIEQRKTMLYTSISFRKVFRKISKKSMARRTVLNHDNAKSNIWFENWFGPCKIHDVYGEHLEKQYNQFGTLLLCAFSLIDQKYNSQSS